MRLFISGSAPLLAETHRAFSARTGHAILERYGMTETNMNTSNPYDGARIAGTVGFPLPGVSLRVVDPETGAALPQGEIGMIEVKGPNVFKGYWLMPEKTAAEFRPDGFFITGDLGRIDDKGYVHIVGRGKDLIISGGLNIYPKEVETEIDSLPGVVESAVIGLPRPRFRRGCRGRRGARKGRRHRRGRDPRGAAGPAGEIQMAEGGLSSSTICRATRWARCRRTCSARPTAAELLRTAACGNARDPLSGSRIPDRNRAAPTRARWCRRLPPPYRSSPCRACCPDRRRGRAGGRGRN